MWACHFRYGSEGNSSPEIVIAALPFPKSFCKVPGYLTKLVSHLPTPLMAQGEREGLAGHTKTEQWSCRSDLNSLVLPGRGCAANCRDIYSYVSLTWTNRGDALLTSRYPKSNRRLLIQCCMRYCANSNAKLGELLFQIRLGFLLQPLSP